MIFDDLACSAIDRQTNACIFFGFRENNVYMIDMSNLQYNVIRLWHRRLGHISFDQLSRINNKKAVKGIPYLKFEKYRICDGTNLGNKLSPLSNPSRIS